MPDFACCIANVKETVVALGEIRRSRSSQMCSEGFKSGVCSGKKEYLAIVLAKCS